MIIRREFKQGSLEWMMARAGLPTASEFDNLVTPEFKLRTGQMPQTYLAKKLAEKWQGSPLPQFNAWDVDQGHFLEEEAIPFYQLRYETEIDRVAMITTDDGKIGCSPDGMFADGTGIEIKCPTAHVHVGYLLNGGLPPEYAAQVHGSMLVAEAPSWRFMSYRRSFPPLVLTIERNEEIQTLLRSALSLFLANMERGMAILTELNEGPPRCAVQQAVKEAYQSDDIIP